MANAIVTVKIMPESVEIDLDALEAKAKQEIQSFAGEGDTRTEVEPIAFGLKAVKITFVMDEKLGSPDFVAEKIEAYDEVASAEITDVRRAIGWKQMSVNLFFIYTSKKVGEADNELYLIDSAKNVKHHISFC